MQCWYYKARKCSNSYWRNWCYTICSYWLHLIYHHITFSFLGGCNLCRPYLLGSGLYNIKIRPSLLKWVRYQKLSLSRALPYSLYCQVWLFDWFATVCMCFYFPLKFLSWSTCKSLCCEFCCWWFDTLKGSECEESLQELATWCHGNFYLLQHGCFFSFDVVRLRFWREPGCCSLHFRHDHFRLLSSDRCVSRLTLY